MAQFRQQLGYGVDQIVERDEPGWPQEIYGHPKERIGIVVQATGARVARLAAVGNARGPVLDLAFEAKLRAATPLTSRRPNKTFDMALTGDMTTYRWGLEANPRIAPLIAGTGSR
ncbi:hypothetical protein [Paraburkholderia aromaticivorans]|uniref:hypothetical protein n=1 Tax=Paraburkholderia aromaticivorans TaxID=2026199 RepID=UPI0038BC9F5C